MNAALPPDYTAFICELVEGFEIDTILYRGRRLDLPVLESADDRPFDLAAMRTARRFSSPSTPVAGARGRGRSSRISKSGVTISSGSRAGSWP